MFSSATAKRFRSDINGDNFMVLFLIIDIEELLQAFQHLFFLLNRAIFLLAFWSFNAISAKLERAMTVKAVKHRKALKIFHSSLTELVYSLRWGLKISLFQQASLDVHLHAKNCPWAGKYCISVFWDNRFPASLVNGSGYPDSAWMACRKGFSSPFCSLSVSTSLEELLIAPTLWAVSMAVKKNTPRIQQVYLEGLSSS